MENDIILERYFLFQKRLVEFVQNHQLDLTGVMPNDIPELKERAADYFSKISENPKMITDIGQDIDWLNLQTAIQQSKEKGINRT